MVQLSPHTEGKMLRYQFFKKVGGVVINFWLDKERRHFQPWQIKNFLSNISIQERKRWFFTLKNCGKIMHLKSITLTISSYVIWYFPCLIWFQISNIWKCKKSYIGFQPSFVEQLQFYLEYIKKRFFDENFSLGCISIQNSS